METVKSWFKKEPEFPGKDKIEISRKHWGYEHGHKGDVVEVECWDGNKRTIGELFANYDALTRRMKGLKDSSLVSVQVHDLLETERTQIRRAFLRLLPEDIQNDEQQWKKRNNFLSELGVFD